MEPPKTRTAEAIWRKENKTGGFALPDFRPDYKPAVTKMIRHWHKRDTDQ